MVVVGSSDRPAVVLDVGSALTKAGFAGEVRPAVEVPSSVAPEDAIDMGGQPGSICPFKDGVVQNWDAMESLWQHVFYKRLHVYPEDQAVLLTEQALTTPEAREHAAEILFESLDVPRLHIAPQPQLALYADYALRQGEGAAAALTGLVMESGDGPTHITPLVDGYLLTPGCRTLGAGGAHVTSRVQELLRARSGVAAARGVTVQQAVEVKHRHCYVCTDPEAAPGAEPTGGRQHGATAAGEEDQLGPEAWQGPEIMFTGAQTLQDLVIEAVQACPIDTRRGLLSNIILSGGNTMLKGFADRLEREVRAGLVVRNMAGAASGVRVTARPSRKRAVWLGGSILAASDAFGDMVITRQAYEESGPALFHGATLAVAL